MIIPASLPWILFAFSTICLGIACLKFSSKQKEISQKERELQSLDRKAAELSKDNSLLSSNLKDTTQKLEHINVRLEELNRLKDDFVSVASHELRTPMTAIRSYAWMALHKSDTPLSQKLEKYLIRILLSAERLIKLVNDLLNISRIESKKIEITPEPIDLISLCRDIIDEVYYSKSQDKDIKMLLLEQPLPKIFADPEKLREILLNIVGNAIKFSPSGRKIIISFFTDGKSVEVSVKDEGPGISKDDLSKLFRKFGRLDDSYTTIASSGGTGLGLYISKNLIELMHGKIWVTSEGINKGSTFTFSLPVANAEILAHVDEYKVRAKDEAKGLEPVAI